jgi:hypothetical protein
MRSRNNLRKLVAACSLTLALIASHAGAAHAAQQGGGYQNPQSCEAAGYQWSNVTKSCADKSCMWFGGLYYPGESISMKTPSGYVFYFCDGFTGKMTQLIKRNPTPPLQLQPQGSLTFF